MKADGAVHVDYSILCYGCGKVIRNVQGVDIENIYSDEDGEDICGACYMQYIAPADNQPLRHSHHAKPT